MSKDTIYRQDAIDALEWTWAGKAAFDAIKNLPSAEPEIIRCKDCKHRTELFDTRWHPCTDVPTNDYWYCADAERRTDE